MVQVPAATSVTVAPDTVQKAEVVEAKVTAKPEEAVALAVKGGVQPGFWGFSEAETNISIEPNSFLLNQPLAAQPGVEAGDTVFLAFRNPAMFSSEEPLS